MKMEESVIPEDKDPSLYISDSESFESHSSSFSFSIIKKEESASVEKKSIINLIILIHKKLFPDEEEIYDLYLDNDDKKVELIKDKILAKVDQLLKINNKSNAQSKNMLIDCSNNQKNFINIQKNDNNLNKNIPELKIIKIEKEKENNYNFKNVAQSMRILEKKDEEKINPLNSNKINRGQGLSSMNPKLKITKNKKTMIINQKHTSKSNISEKFIFKNIQRNKNEENEIINKEKERAKSCAWKKIITKVVYVAKPSGSKNH
jgi:hypothetical protein